MTKPPPSWRHLKLATKGEGVGNAFLGRQRLAEGQVAIGVENPAAGPRQLGGIAHRIETVIGCLSGGIYPTCQSVPLRIVGNEVTTAVVLANDLTARIDQVFRADAVVGARNPIAQCVIFEGPRVRRRADGEQSTFGIVGIVGVPPASVV